MKTSNLNLYTINITSQINNTTSLPETGTLMYSGTSSPQCFSFLFFILLLLLVPFSAYGQSYRNISLGSSLTANGDNTSWPSPSGDFAFGFRLVGKDRFLLAIWFDKIPEKTIVWYANGNETAPRGSQVELTTKGRLVIKSPRGRELWKAETGKGEIRHGAMLDNGNFVLVGNSTYSWESFMNPTDTILPGQFLEINRASSKLTSRANDSSYAKGRFRLRLHENGNFVIYPVAVPSLTENAYDAYYNLTWLTGGKNPNASRFIFNTSGNIYIESKNGRIVNLDKWSPIVPGPNVYYRATLDFDGVFTQYSHPKTSDASSRWTSEAYIPDDICRVIEHRLGTGACGYNSYCTLISNGRASCDCPPGYELVDSNNKFGNCRPNFRLQTCQEVDTRNASDLFELQSLANVDWPTTDYEALENYNEQDCRESCLNDCLCAVALFVGGTCWKKKLPLPNGRLNAALNGIALIKIRKDRSLDPDQVLLPAKKRSALNLVISVLLGSSVFLNFLLLAATFLVYFFMDKKLRKQTRKPTTLRSSIRSFTYVELEEATDGFKEELGRGAFGVVYKGLINEEMSSSYYIAVKKLDKVFGEGEKEFKTEVNAVGQTHHKNLVRLLGFCEEGQHRLLVYEFMSNSSLADHLFGISKPDWNQRVQIACGISRGLMYLHDECSTQIIHCDIKPQNILLDDNFTAQISDFGLAKLLVSNQTRTNTGIRGTRGYVAPEWFRNAPVSAKVDVYSFGVMLLEIICCRKGVDFEPGEDEVKAILTDWAYDCFRQGKLQDLVVDDEEVMSDMKRFERMVMIAIWCIQEEPSLRPSMKRVTQMLEGVLEVSEPPCPYLFNSYISELSEPNVVYQDSTSATSN